MTNKQLIFEGVFGENWNKLPNVLQQHYLISPNIHHHVTFTGKMNITTSGSMRFLLPLFKLFGILVPYIGNNIPAIVKLHNTPNTNKLYYNRTFYFPNKKPYHFNSYMQPIKDNIVVEILALCLGWRTAYIYEENKIVMHHKGYVCKIGNLYIPLPINWFMGTVRAEQIALSDKTFRFQMEVKHSLLGTYTYCGDFEISDAL